MSPRATIRLTVAAGVLALALSACSSSSTGAASTSSSGSLTPVTLVLDWTPNTNHTGLYVAKAKGWYAEQGIDLTIVQPPEDGAEALVGSGKAQFGISPQEAVTQARAQDVPIVSIAAVLAHNTSAFASPVDRGITRPKQYGGHTYGGWGSPMESAIIDALVATDGGDPATVTKTDIGTTSVIEAFSRGIDIGWIYEGWDDALAKEKGIDLNVQLVRDYGDALDWYTPTIISNEKLIASDPDLVQRFVNATSKGYQYAIAHPDESAQILLDAAPDLDATQVKASQQYLADQYQADSAEWGYQRPEVWKDFTGWLEDHGIIAAGFNYDAAYTDTFVEATAK